MGIAFRISTAKNSECRPQQYMAITMLLPRQIHSCKKRLMAIPEKCKETQKTPTAFRSFCPVEGKNMDNDGDKTIRLS